MISMPSEPAKALKVHTSAPSTKFSQKIPGPGYKICPMRVTGPLKREIKTL